MKPMTVAHFSWKLKPSVWIVAPGMYALGMQLMPLIFSYNTPDYNIFIGFAVLYADSCLLFISPNGRYKLRLIVREFISCANLADSPLNGLYISPELTLNGVQALLQECDLVSDQLASYNVCLSQPNLSHCFGICGCQGTSGFGCNKRAFGAAGPTALAWYTLWPATTKLLFPTAQACRRGPDMAWSTGWVDGRREGSGRYYLLDSAMFKRSFYLCRTIKWAPSY